MNPEYLELRYAALAKFLWSVVGQQLEAVLVYLKLELAHLPIDLPLEFPCFALLPDGSYLVASEEVLCLLRAEDDLLV